MNDEQPSVSRPVVPPIAHIERAQRQDLSEERDRHSISSAGNYFYPQGQFVQKHTLPVIQVTEAAHSKKNSSTYFGYESPYPNPSDVARHERSRSNQGERNATDRSVSTASQQSGQSKGQMFNQPLAMHFNDSSGHRGQTRCKWCTALVSADGTSIALHEQDCPFAPIVCGLTDTETGDVCHVSARGRKLLAEHQTRCPMRRVLCTNGCGQEVSVQSTAVHIQECGKQLIQCRACKATHPRAVDDEHQLHCREAMVNCPLGCGAIMRRREVPEHIRTTAASHVPRVHYTLDPAQAGADDQHPADSPSVVYAILLQLIRNSECVMKRMQERERGSCLITPEAQKQQSATQSHHKPVEPTPADGEQTPIRSAEHESDAGFMSPPTVDRSLPELSPYSEVRSQKKNFAPFDAPDPQVPSHVNAETIRQLKIGSANQRSANALSHLFQLSKTLDWFASNAHELEETAAVVIHRKLKEQIALVPQLAEVAGDTVSDAVEEIEGKWYQCQCALYDRTTP